jgi:hypothetical protein
VRGHPIPRCEARNAHVKFRICYPKSSVAGSTAGAGFFPHMDEKLDDLAALAEPEPWDYRIINIPSRITINRSCSTSCDTPMGDSQRKAR